MKDKVYEVKFHFGVKKVSKKRVYITAMFLALAVDILHRLFKFSPQLMWEFIDIIGQDLKIDVINQIILQAPELLQDRIEREVDGALDDLGLPPEPTIEDPTWINDEEGETPLGGPLGYTYDFVEKPSKENSNEQS